MKLTRIAAGAGALVLVATVLLSPAAQARQMTEDDRTVYVDLEPQGGSQQSGVAVLYMEEGKLFVTVLLDDAPETPVTTHIRRGICASPNATALFTLNATEDGYSDTTLDTNLDDLLNTPSVVTVDRSGGGGFAACGEIVFRDDVLGSPDDEEIGEPMDEPEN